MRVSESSRSIPTDRRHPHGKLPGHSSPVSSEMCAAHPEMIQRPAAPILAPVVNLLTDSVDSLTPRLINAHPSAAPPAWCVETGLFLLRPRVTA